MPPAHPPVPRNLAEPPQEGPPDGRWADRLRAEFLAAAADLEDAATIGALSFFPDRTWHGYTYVPLSGRTESGNEVYGYVRFLAGTDGRDQSDFTAYADLSDEVIGSWRGGEDQLAQVTLVWGTALVEDGVVATAELGEHTVDQCALVERRFTLIAPDDFAGALLEVRLYAANDAELARESLYADE